MSNREPFYQITRVRRLAQEGKCDVLGRARRTALDDFGWNYADIKRAIKTLQKKDFLKTEQKYDNPGLYVDFYKARGLLGENVYLHFRIEGGRLIICSFKRI